MQHLVALDEQRTCRLSVESISCGDAASAGAKGSARDWSRRGSVGDTRL